MPDGVTDLVLELVAVGEVLGEDPKDGLDVRVAEGVFEFDGVFDGVVEVVRVRDGDRDGVLVGVGEVVIVAVSVSSWELTDASRRARLKKNRRRFI